MGQLKLEDFKNIVFCKLNKESLSSLYEENFGIRIQNTSSHKSEDIENYLKNNFAIKYQGLYNHCCRSNSKEYIISGFIEFSQPEIIDDNRDITLINNDHILNEFKKFKIGLEQNFNGLDFEILIVDLIEQNSHNYIKW